MNIATISLDVAKSVFQVHGADAEGRAGQPSNPNFVRFES